MEPPSVVAVTKFASVTTFRAVGNTVSIVPAALPALAIVIAPPVIAVVPMSQVITASPTVIAPCKQDWILTIVPANGTAKA